MVSHWCPLSTGGHKSKEKNGKIIRSYVFSFQFYLGQTCKKFQDNRISLTMKKVSSNTQRQVRDFFARVFPFCTRGKKYLSCDVNLWDIQLFLSQLRSQCPEGYSSLISSLSVQ